MDEIRIVNKNGRDIKLTSYQKNEIYRRAKRLREELRDVMCTKRECSKATPERVNKMLNSEFKAAQKMDYYVKSMKVIGAEPKDYDLERIRR